MSTNCEMRWPHKLVVSISLMPCIASSETTCYPTLLQTKQFLVYNGSVVQKMCTRQGRYKNADNEAEGRLVAHRRQERHGGQDPTPLDRPQRQESGQQQAD